MNETKNIFLPSKEIFENLKEFIKENSSIEVWIGRIKVEKDMPIIVFNEARNELTERSTSKNFTRRTLNYNINVYSSDNNSFEIVQYLATLICHFMQDIYQMEGGIIATLPSFDIQNRPSYQANLRFTTRFIPSKNKLY